MDIDLTPENSELQRMLLSHNFNVSPDRLPALDREQFAAIFQAGLEQVGVPCRLLHHPHWQVEIRFSSAVWSPRQIGELCAQALIERRSQQVDPLTLPEVLVLGGLKTTPPTSDAPEALQPGEWGVDVVETESGEAFLQTIAWEATIAQRPAESVFKIDWRPA